MTKRIAVVLDGLGGELDREEFNVAEGRGEEDAISRRSKEIIGGWTLSVGDTITIREI